jgi:predicted phosphodiesterase
MTRVAVISDVHANIHALRAVLAALQELGVSRYMCAGDIVGYGPHPNECVEQLQELPLVAVAGNHDLVALGRADAARCNHLARQTLEWTVAQLTDASRQWLDGLPVVFSDGEVAMTHGSLADRFEKINSAERAAGELDDLSAQHPRARLLLVGHTHIPMAYGSASGMLNARQTRVLLDPAQRYVLNPGSVGQSRDRSPHASCLVLDLAAGEGLFMRVAYDIAACRADLGKQGLPLEACHRPPVLRSNPRRVARRIKRLFRVRGDEAASDQSRWWRNAQ